MVIYKYAYQDLDGEKMHNVGIIVNESKDVNLKITRAIIKWIENRGGSVLIPEVIALNVGKPQYGYRLETVYENADFIIVLGGDGTLLGVSREVSRFEKPLLGVNLGHLGFLAEVEVKELFIALEMVFNGNIKIEKRLMLNAITEGAISKNFYALNDIVITRGLSRLITMNLYINDDYVTTLNGDGMIIATPTGSTAYSLSAGGPIVNPSVPVIILTPICPHSLSTRPIIIADNEVVKVELVEKRGDAYITMDGQESYKIEEGESIVIKKAPFKTNLIKLINRSFYDVLKAKLTEK